LVTACRAYVPAAASLGSVNEASKYPVSLVVVLGATVSGAPDGDCILSTTGAFLAKPLPITFTAAPEVYED